MDLSGLFTTIDINWNSGLPERSEAFIQDASGNDVWFKSHRAHISANGPGTISQDGWTRRRRSSGQWSQWDERADEYKNERSFNDTPGFGPVSPAFTMAFPEERHYNEWPFKEYSSRQFFAVVRVDDSPCAMAVWVWSVEVVDGGRDEFNQWRTKVKPNSWRSFKYSFASPGLAQTLSTLFGGGPIPDLR